MLIAASALLSPPGAGLDAQIAGGRPARAAQFPYIVALSRIDPGTGMRIYFCGGTLVDRQWILSAAHCFFDRNGIPIDARDLWVAVAADELKSYPLDDQLAVSRVVVHPGYSAATLANDIALVRLAAARPDPVLIRLATDQMLEGLVATIIGYGSQSEGQLLVRDRNSSGERIGVLSTRLQRADVMIRPNAVCSQQLAGMQDVPGFEGLRISADQLCAGDRNSDACQGDSGGPILVADSDGRYVQAGIVSFGRGCARGYDAVYTRVSAYAGWIAETMSRQ